MQLDKFNKTDFPLLAFKKNDKNIYVFNKHFGIVSKGGGSFYKGLTIINSKGEMYYTNGYKIIGKAKFIHSLIYFQKMLQLKVFFKDETNYISLVDLKKMIFDHVSENPKRWLILDTIEGLKETINEAKDYKELIRLFR